jgi:hypothetical protein
MFYSNDTKNTEAANRYSVMIMSEKKFDMIKKLQE